MIWQITLNCLQTGHWVRVNHFIVMDWAHVLVIVQTDGCSLSCKDGAFVWQSFGKLAAGCLTILETAVDDRRCHYSLVHLGAISVNIIMRSLRFMILTELDLGFLSGNHAFAYSFNGVGSPGIVIMRSWWKVECPQGADQSGIDLCRGHGFRHFETNGSGLRPKYSMRFMICCMCTLQLLHISLMQSTGWIRDKW